ncbi:MAG TPA: hypothetical protein VGS10_12105 [Terracidiphilus sp.]|nr:hypothetical protein [Terracidiphilus sp.]
MQDLITSPATYRELLLFVAAGTGFWLFDCFVSSFLLGWHRLSNRFSSTASPLGDIKTVGPFRYVVYMKLGQYGSTIRMTAANDALYLSVILAFRPGHPPLRIPWNEISLERTRRFFRNCVVLTLGTEERIPMRISERMARKLGLFERFPALALVEPHSS